MKKILPCFLLISSTQILFAAIAKDVTDVTNSVYGKMVDYILTPLYSFAVGVSFMWFLFWVAVYMFNMDQEETRNKAKSHLLYGFLGLFIIFSIGAIFGFFDQIFGGLFGFA